MDNTRCYHCEKCCERTLPGVKNCPYCKTRDHRQEENDLYEQACNRLAFLFGQKHGWRFEGWAGSFNPSRNTWQEGTGGWAHYGDWVVMMDDIRADLMMDAPVDEYLNYMDASLQEHERAQQEGRQPLNINYRSWLIGARYAGTRPDSEFVRLKREELERASEAVRMAKEELKKALNNHHNKLF